MDSLLDKLRGKKVVIIGDIMLDHYIWGDAGRISPEAPVPVVDVDKDSYVPGGAANVALNINSLGGQAILCGSLARDEAGQHLIKLLSKEGVSLDDSFATAKGPTIVKTRVIVRNQQLCRLDREDAPHHYSLEQDPAHWKILEAQVQAADAVIFSDYSKGVVTETLIDRVKAVAKASNTLLAMDPKPRRSLAFNGLDLMTPNKKESLQLANIDLDPHEPFPEEEVCERLWERFKTKQLVVTLGGGGMLLSESGKVIKKMPTVAKEVFDVSGAGDTVIAALTLALSQGSSLEQACHFANVAAGIVVSKIGTATASVDEVKQYLA